MPEETAEIVRSVGLELVSRLAPEELPLYPALVSQFQGARRGRGKASSDDQLLGFGAAEAMTMLTPVILSFTRSFWQALLAETARDSVQAVVECVKSHLPGHREAAAEPRPLTPGQLQLVRTVAEREARQLDVSEGQAGLLADAMVGVLTAPPVS